MTEIKYMDIKEFREEGFLQEVNRLFFHPRGLALEVRIDDDGNETLGGIWDYRDDPEGIVFSDTPEPEKAINVSGEAEKHAIPRVQKFGWVIQPVYDHG